MSNRVTEADFEEWNERMVIRYDVDQFHNHPSPAVRFIERRRVAKVVSYVDPQPGQDILEVGCGAGHVLQAMPCGNLSGVDLSETLVARARERLQGRATIERGNAERLPYPAHRFDKVYCSEVLEHVLQPEQVLREIERVVKPGGWVVISIPHERIIHMAKHTLVRLGLFKWLMHQQQEKAYPMHERMQDEWHLREFSLSMLRGLVPKTFEEKRVSGIPFVFPAFHYVVAYQVHKND